MASNYTLTAAQDTSASPPAAGHRLRLATHFLRFESSLQRRIATGATWSIFGAGLASALTMVSNIACASLLGAALFGELAIVLATVNLLTTLFAAGLGMTASRYVAEHRNSDPKRAGTIIGLSWVTSIVVGAATTLLLLSLAPWLSREILHASGLSGALSLAGAVIFFAALNGSQVGTLSGFEAFHRVAFGNLVRGTGMILFVIVGAALGGVTGALLGHVVAGALTALIYQIAVRRECGARGIAISYTFGREDLRILWQFTLPVLVSNLCFAPAAWWSNVLLTSVPAITIAVPVAICAPFIMRLYGPAFEHGATALVLISFAAVLSAIALPIGHVIWSLDATISAVLLALLRGGVLVIASYALAQGGATGLAGAHVIMGVIQTAAVPFTFWILRRRLLPAVP